MSESDSDSESRLFCRTAIERTIQNVKSDLIESRRLGPVTVVVVIIDIPSAVAIDSKSEASLSDIERARDDDRAVALTQVND
jgi:hypothetical protein